jgi:hypothetical protein
MLSFHLDGVYSARQLSRLFSIIFIISIIRIIILDCMDIWAGQSMVERGGRGS